MTPLKIEATIDTPAVILDKAGNVFEIEGKSYPEDTREFYDPILSWINEYVKDPNPSTSFVFKLKYFNSSSYKPIYDIIRMLQGIKDKGNEVMVQWYYKEGDSDMLEAGEEYADFVDIEFSYHQSE